MSDRVERLLACLPQTQCQLCDYEGCKPYAKAIDQGEVPIDRCAPGGRSTLEALAAVMQTSPEPFYAYVDAHFKAPSAVRIDEEACIGCTKCIPVCPVGAIAGAPKHLHQVLTHACTGCDLCLPSCPVDCIHPTPAPSMPKSLAPYHRQAYEHTQDLLKKRLDEKQQRYQRKKTLSADLLKKIQSS